jgi:hypothetical protein
MKLKFNSNQTWSLRIQNITAYKQRAAQVWRDKPDNLHLMIDTHSIPINRCSRWRMSGNHDVTECPAANIVYILKRQLDTRRQVELWSAKV